MDSFDFDLKKVPLYTIPGGVHRRVSNRMGIQHSTTNECLSIVGNNYRLHQPKEIEGFFDTVAHNLGYAEPDKRVLKGGRFYSAQARVPMEVEFSDERAELYLTLLSSCDWSFQTYGFYMSSLLACDNQVRLALAQCEKKFSAKMPHSRDFDVDYFVEELGFGEEDLFNALKAESESWEDMAGRLYYYQDREDFFAHVAAKKLSFEMDYKEYQDVYSPKTYQSGLGYVPKHKRIVDKLLYTYATAPGQQLECRRNTLWGAVNAVTYWADHVRGKDAPTRHYNRITGAADAYKASAFSLAREALG